MTWRELPIPRDPRLAHDAVRLNSFGSLYFFSKNVLRRKRLVSHLHGRIAQSFESDHTWFLMEMPRDHFKTTLVSEALPIWWALPFGERDEALMRGLGYDDAWIAWMRRCHDPTTSIFISSETDRNAERIGKRIDKHYETNDRFKALFPEIIPTSETWNNQTKQQKVPPPWFKAEGEGTFDYGGVNSAVQSTHYRRSIEDDLVGRDALRSDTVMEDTIQYHQLLIGAFDQLETEIVCGNRWKHNDLNGHIREEEKYFQIESHGALGGCCPMHPAGSPIFPEEWDTTRLEMYRARLGPYLFSHQFLNVPLLPEECIFKAEWARFYKPVPAPMQAGPGRHYLGHEVYGGETLPDLNPNTLIRTLIGDPHHSETGGKSNPSLIVTGLDPESDRIYVLDIWNDSRSYDAFFNAIYRMAERWGLIELWLETVAAQKYCKYHIEYRNRVEGRHLRVRELKTARNKDAKRDRIEALEPLFRNGQIWLRHDQSALLNEYYAYPSSSTLDLLDVLGYAPQTWQNIYNRGIVKMTEERRMRRMAVKGHAGY